MSVKDLFESIKTGFAVSGTTIGTGLGTILDWIPNDIGKLGVLIGAGLSLVLIRKHLRSGKVGYEKTKLENEKLRLEIEAMRNKDA